jgi:hypothetical protein
MAFRSGAAKALNLPIIEGHAASQRWYSGAARPGSQHGQLTAPAASKRNRRFYFRTAMTG